MNGLVVIFQPVFRMRAKAAGRMAATSLSPPSHIPLRLPRVSSGFAFVCEHCGFCIMFAAYW